MSKSIRRSLMILIAGITVASSLFTMSPAAAVSNQGPDPADFMESNRYGNSFPGVGRTVDYMVATSASNPILQTTLRVYLPTPTGQIVIHNPHICYNTFRVGGRNYDALDDGVINSSGHAVVFALVGGPQFQWGDFDGSGTCDSKTVALNLSGNSLDPNTGMYTYSILVSANPATDKYMNTFWLTGPAGSVITQDSAQPTSSFGMNQTSPLQGNNPSNTQFPPNPYINYSTWNMKFAPDCTMVTPTATKRIEIFDDDNRNNWAVQPRPFLVKLQEMPRSGGSWVDVPPNPGSPSFPDGFGGSANAGGGFLEVYTTASSKRIWLDYTFKRDMIYQWILDSVYVDNTLQFKLPYDGIYFLRECATNNYNLTPSINASITSGGSSVTGSIAEPGDSVTFTYAVNNTGSTPSGPVTCNIYANNHAGYFAVPSPAESTGSAPPGAPSCPATFPAGNTTLSPTETVNNLPANTTVCRSLYVNPSTPGGGPLGTEVCIVVASKPYIRAYGGDIMAGNAPPTTTNCTPWDAMIVGWNRRTAGGWSGAASQYGIYAYNVITDFATSLNSAAAGSPSGLAFANTTIDPPNGSFGGSFGPLPCMPDFYAALPNGATDLPANPNVGTLPSGTYKSAPASALTLAGGSLPANKRITIYVLGDVFINSDISYNDAGGWSVATIPQFRLIVSGNIYIGNTVARLDGQYVAQRNSPTTGNLRTCATGAFLIPLDGTLYANCNLKLTINGSIVGKQILPLRTFGTLSQSTAGETGAGGAAAEVINYTPALWLVQPNGQAGSADYDSIISLPPVL